MGDVMEGVVENMRSQWAWKFWWTLPIYPFGQRRTLKTTVVEDQVWTFEQLQGVFYVVTPIRMTVVRLAAGGLLVYAPIAPTFECITWMNELVNEYGDVKYIILPTVSGLEHKVFVGPFARQFKTAVVYVMPHQLSYPVQLPLSWLGLPIGRTQVLPDCPSDTPFGDEFDYAMLGPISLGVGPFAEVAFFHRASRSVLITDAILSVSETPPAMVNLEPTALLYHARDNAADVVKDTPENRIKGWKRIALFSFYFRPSAVEIINFGLAWREAREAGKSAPKAYFGLYPFCWKNDWERSFDALSCGGRLFVAPILQQLILNRDPKGVLDWADRVAAWDLDRLIPCHLESPVMTNSIAFRQAFAFLEREPSAGHLPLPPDEFKLLRDIEAQLVRRKITPPAKVL